MKKLTGMRVGGVVLGVAFVLAGRRGSGSLKPAHTLAHGS